MIRNSKSLKVGVTVGDTEKQLHTISKKLITLPFKI